MYRGDRSRILPVIIVLIVIALAIAGLVAAGRAIFGGDQPNTDQPDTSREALLDTASLRSVRMTVRGPLVADENFRSYQVTVSNNSRTLTTYSGYLSQPLASKELSNNNRAYDEFVHALDKANLVTGEAFTGDKDDTRGICAGGRVYEFEVLDGDMVVKRLWSSTCKGSPGSLKASRGQVETLFLGQIPDQRELLKTVDL